MRQSSRLIIVDPLYKLLLFRYHDEHQGPFWATVGGELKGSETYLDTAARELYEETGFDVPIGRFLCDRKERFAVANSQPDVWHEKYFLVEVPRQPLLATTNWTEEERSTIINYKWWELAEMLSHPRDQFKPEWLPSLLRQLRDDAG